MKRYLIFVVLLCVLLSCKKKTQVLVENRQSTSLNDLFEITADFEKQVLKVGEKTYVAIGYGLANSIMIEGDKGLVIIDAMESVQQGEAVMKAFREISDKPVLKLIYTHNHTDHVFGAKAFVEEGVTEVIAHQSLPHYLDQVASVVRPIIEQRSYRMFGNFLSPDEIINCGIGKHLEINEETLLSVVRPTTTFADSFEVNLDDIVLKLFHAPGETADQLFVYKKDEGMIFCGDNFYNAFPNLYTIRGTPYRDVNTWVASLDHMRSLNPNYLVPSHTLPIEGKGVIEETLRDYRDAIQFVHDQTIRYLNHGLTPDEIVAKVMLPKQLSTKPYLKEYYGKVEWSVRSIITGYLGWFGGNPSELARLNIQQRANRFSKLAGGEEELYLQMNKAIEEEDFAWAMELTDQLIVLDYKSTDVKSARIICLEAMAEKETNPNARHYYYTCARELAGLENNGLITPSEEMVHDVPLDIIFKGMSVHLKAEKALDVEKSISWYFTDVKEYRSLVIRNGVAERSSKRIENADFYIEVESNVWKELAAELIGSTKTFLSGKVKVNGNKIDFVKTMNLFEKVSDIEEESIYLK